MTILTTETRQKLANYKDEFLRVHPNIGQKVVNEEVVPMTDAEWLDEVVKQWLKAQLKRGSKLLQSDEITPGDFNDIE